MKTYSLDKLERRELQEVWQHEAHDFTPWLAEESNLEMLGDAIGIELELIETESSVGSFSVGIYASEIGTSRKVVIENQLKETNHDHLGKVITYAAGKNAEVVVWVVAHAREEHRQAIEWLNEHTDDDVAFFLVEIELWAIGDSLPAPRFNVVERPNEWARSVRHSEDCSDTENLRLSYWTRYREIAANTSEFARVFKPRKPSRARWTILGCGTSAYHLALIVDVLHGRTGIEFYASDNKEMGEAVIAESSRIERELGVVAEPFRATKDCGVRFFHAGRPLKDNETAWDGYIREQMNWALDLRRILDEMGL